MLTRQITASISSLGIVLFACGCGYNPQQFGAVPIQAPSYRGPNTVAICDTDPELSITKITSTDTQTIINMRFDATREMMIRAAAPGRQTAFYIFDPDTRKEYNLTDVSGISLEPTFTHLNVGSSLEFALTFERLPDSVKRFHMIEGKTPSMDSNGQPTETWTFMNVQRR